jgi:hypothetical protein
MSTNDNAAFRAVKSRTRLPTPAKYPISVETMELAFKFLARQLLHAHALYLRGEGKSSGMGVAQAIAKFLVSRPAR